MTTSKHLEGKGVVVTGAGRGIGREIALAVARAGGKVIVNDLDREVGPRRRCCRNDPPPG